MEKSKEVGQTPVETLNVAEDDKELKPGCFGRLAIWSLVFCNSVGIFWASNNCSRKSGMEGMIPAWPFIIAFGVICGAVFCAIFTLISIIRQERNCIWGVIAIFIHIILISLLWFWITR